MKVRLDLTEGTLEQIDELVAAEREKSPSVTRRSWIMGRLYKLAGLYVQPNRILRGTGRYSVLQTPTGQSIFIKEDELPTDLVMEEGPVDGTEMLLPDKLVQALTRGCSVTTAANKAIGRANSQTWHGPREWASGFVTDQAANAAAERDAQALLEEEKGLNVAERLETARARRRAQAIGGIDPELSGPPEPANGA